MAKIRTRQDKPELRDPSRGDTATQSGSPRRLSTGKRPASKPPKPVQLARLIEQSKDMSGITGHLVLAATRALSANAVAYYQRDPNGKLVVVAESSQNAMPWNTPALVQLCETATEKQTGLRRNGMTTRQEQAIVVPVPGSVAPHDAMMALMPQGTNHPDAVVLLELVANGFSQWRMQQTAQRLDWEARTAAAIAELVRNVGSCQSLREGAFLIANELARHFQSDHVVVGLCEPNRPDVEIEAISGRGEFDAKSKVIKSLQQALNESTVRGTVTVWPPLDGTDRHATLAHRKYAEEARVESVVTAPLLSDDGELVGACLFAAPREVLHNKQRLDAIRTIAPHLATAVTTRRAAEPGKLQQMWANVFPEDDSKRRNRLLFAATVLAILPLIPIPYKIRANCLIEPTERRFAVAPYDGILKETLVEPGEVVTQGQLMAKMDDREIRWELTGLSAEAVRAGKKRDVAMAEHNTPEAQMAQLERERLNVKMALLRDRQQNLEINSQLEGVVLKGDLEDAQGAPVRMGQALFEVAPLNSLQLEIAVPETDIAYVEVGDKITARIDGSPDGKLTGVVERIQPRSEIRDDQNVFVAEVRVDNNERKLLPGMSGRAKVVTPRKMIGWIVFHKAWHRLRNLMGA